MLKPLCVLKIGSSEEDTLWLRRHLRLGGYDVTLHCADTPGAMREALERQQWDIVIADYDLPGFSTPAAIALLKERGFDLPFFVIAAGGGEDLAVSAMRAGAHDYFQKERLTRLVPAIERELGAVLHRRERRQAEVERSQSFIREQVARGEAEAAQRRQAFLAEASRILASSLDYETTLASVAQLPVPYLADWSVIQIVRDDRSHPAVAAAHVDPVKQELLREMLGRYPFTEIRPGESLETMRFSQSYLVPEITDSIRRSLAQDAEHLQMLVQLGCTSFMVVPLVERGRILGVLWFGTAGSRRRFGPTDLTMAEDLAQLAALAVDKADLYRESREAYRRLDESHALLDGLLASASTGFAFFDRDHRYVRINEALAAINGQPVEAHLGRPLREMVPGIADELERFFDQVVATGEPIDQLELIRERWAVPGVRRYWINSIYPVRTRKGETIGVGVMVTEISDRKRMEEALRESETLLAWQKRILELIARGEPLAGVLENTVSFIEEISPGCRCAIEMLDSGGRQLRFAAAPSLPESFMGPGYTVPVGPRSGSCGTAVHRREAVIVMDTATDPLWEDYRQIASDFGLKACWATPVFGSVGEVFGTVSVYFATSRGPTPLESKLVEISTHLVSIAVERNKAEEARNLKLQTLVAHMAEGVVAVDQGQRVLVVNPTAYRLLSLTESAPPAELSSRDFPAVLAEMLQNASQLEPGSPARRIFPWGKLEIEAYVSSVATQFGQYGAIALLRDVTAEIQFRRLQESFVSNVSHELRGPLASLSAVVEAMRDGLIPAEGRGRYLEALLAETGRMRRLTDELLDLSKLDAGIMQLSRNEFELALLCDAVQQMWSLRCAAAGVTLQVECATLRVAADYDRVEQVLVNFLDNALNFTPSGGTIRIFASREGDRARVCVADTGTGIPPEYLPYIWERFFKVDRARTLTPERGTGLGLAIVKQLVARMGGEVHVESAPGAGSVFSFTVPLA